MQDFIEPVLSEVIVISYTGNVNEKDLYHGKGVAVLDNQCVYEGSFKNGLFNGKGKYIWDDNVTFEGEFVNGMVRLFF